MAWAMVIAAGLQEKVWSYSAKRSMVSRGSDGRD
jgi:hypothetical protein